MEHSASRSPPGSWRAIWTRTGGEEVISFPAAGRGVYRYGAGERGTYRVVTGGAAGPAVRIC
jgi:hypothetical protein